ncbi:hypothetical protein [Neorhizobium tomejilense]|uniref:hypothetical protein n=1 Tax=Neorhizobium tomejilense TaxID=2093828 RepID=UPI003ECCE98B
MNMLEMDWSAHWSEFTYEEALARAKNALWKRGVSIIFIIEGYEHEFFFDELLPEKAALADLRARRIALAAAESPKIAVLLTGILGLLTLSLMCALNI